MKATHATRPAHPAARPAPTPWPPGVPELEALFASYGAACYALARTVLRDVDLAQEVVQEAFLEHWRGAGFDATRSTHRGWLLMLTHRRAVDRVRYEERRNSASTGAARESASSRQGRADLALAGDLAPRVRAALSTLPRAQQEVLALAYWGGFTQREVAKITRSPLGTVKTRMQNGMISLQKALVDERD